MIKILTQLICVSIFICNISAQTITEKEIFRLEYKGNADGYSFIQDNASSNYCYFYRIEDEDKTFIISNNSVSEKYDYAGPGDVRFDSKGNYYAVTSNYKVDYGIDNSFLIVNGKLAKNYNYIEAYSSYFNKAGEYVFVFKENELYKLGYYNAADGSFRESEGFENIRPLYKYVEAKPGDEEESEGYSEADYYRNENGERGYVALANGKAKVIFETTEIPTDFSDINETSLVKNKNGVLSFIAKRGGKFYGGVGNEFVVSGNLEYDKFELVNVPLYFNDNNDPVYMAGDSINENKYIYYLVAGNEKQTAVFNNGKTDHNLNFSRYPWNIKLNGDKSIDYFAAVDSMVPAKKKFPEEEVYDKYYSRTFFVRNGNAYDLGYNTGYVKYNDNGDMLYSAMADLNKDERLLMMNYGSSRIIINKKKFDDIYDYGFSPSKEIYYVAQTYQNDKSKKEAMSYLYLGDKLIGKYDYFSYQYGKDGASVLIFDSKNNYAYTATEKIDSVTFRGIVATTSGKLPFPNSKVAGATEFSYVSFLMFTKNDKLFYVGDISSASPDDPVRKEIFVDNKPVGEIYNVISNFKYNESADEVTFIGSRGNAIYSVTVSF